MKKLLLLATAVPLAWCCLPVGAWGGSGHRIVAQIAEDHLNARARAAVAQLLAADGAASLQDVANWADDVRESGDKRLSHLHFNNFPRGDCHYQRSRDCPDGLCAVEGIKRFSAELRDPATPAAERVVALKMLTHLVGDLHQPLHAGYADDKGGNTYQVRVDGRGSNIHAVWDTQLIHNTGLSITRYTGVLEGMHTAATSMQPETWAEESCSIVGRPGFYPANRVIDARYEAQWRPILDGRLLAGGLRLAELLNEDLGQ